MIIGIDEVGRGCWAGPLVAGAVLLTEPISGLADSKKLSAKKRELLSIEVLSTTQYGLGWVTPTEVDELGLTKAVELAMRRALEEIDYIDHEIVLDGDINYLSDVQNTSCLIKADDSVPAVSAASIIAKVARDSYMQQLSKKYPGYGFESHVGYGTKRHLDALNDLGVIQSVHRYSYKPIQRVLGR